MAISIYLFESKGIQAYLGRSGRLADVVTVSDALANLINDNEHSDLALVLNESGLLEKSDLLDSNNDNESNDIHFFRKKGGYGHYIFRILFQEWHIPILWLLTPGRTAKRIMIFIIC